MRGEFVDVGPLRLYYYAAGSRGVGDPVLLLHGFGTSAALWRQFVPQIPAGHRVVTVDLAGHGRSEAPPHVDCTAAAHAGFVAALLDDLGSGPVNVVAHGFGCEIAVQLAARADRVRSLLLISPTGAGDGAAGVPAAQSLAALALRSPWGSLATRPIRRYLARGFTRRSIARRSLERHLRWFATRPRRMALLHQVHTLAAWRATEVTLEQPFEIVVGGDDPFVGANHVGARFLAPARGLLTTLGGERHFLPEEAPDTIARLLTRLLEREEPRSRRTGEKPV